MARTMLSASEITLDWLSRLDVLISAGETFARVYLGRRNCSNLTLITSFQKHSGADGDFHSEVTSRILESVTFRSDLGVNSLTEQWKNYLQHDCFTETLGFTFFVNVRRERALGCNSYELVTKENSKNVILSINSQPGIEMGFFLERIFKKQTFCNSYGLQREILITTAFPLVMQCQHELLPAQTTTYLILLRRY